MRGNCPLLAFSTGPRASPRFSSALTPRRHVAEPDYWTSVPSPLLAFSAGPRASPRFSSALTPRRHVAEPDYWTSVPSPLLAFLSRASRQPPV